LGFDGVWGTLGGNQAADEIGDLAVALVQHIE
jgi:hypothetical protein